MTVKNLKRRVGGDKNGCENLLELNKQPYNSYVSVGGFGFLAGLLTGTQSPSTRAPPVQTPNSSKQGERTTNRLGKREVLGRVRDGSIKKSGGQLVGRDDKCMKEHRRQGLARVGSGINNSYKYLDCPGSAAG
jgi:hypothetical protein